jgi:O-succinylbenzoic acid--CoA ligase
MDLSIIKSKNFVFHSVQLFPDNPFMITEDGVITYTKFYHSVIKCAVKLQTFGIRPNDRVALLLENSRESVVLLFALWQIGAVAVPLNIKWPWDMQRESMFSVNCFTIILNDYQCPNKNLEKINLLLVKELVEFEENPPELEKRTLYEISLQQDATIIFTSGSAGLPKAVLHSLKNHLVSAMGSNVNIPFVPTDGWLVCLPFYHIGGLAILFRAIIGGGGLVLPEREIELFEAVARYNFTHISLVFTQFLRLLKKKVAVEKLKYTKAILLGGSDFPISFIKKGIKLGLPICTSYGSTEMASQISTTKPDGQKKKLFTSGKPLEYRQIKISSEGEILVKGDTLFQGYVSKNRLRPPMKKGGWFKTGDLGYFDQDGFLIVRGRKDNMFISGGVNIQPEEIERALREIPGVTNAVVVAIDSAEFGQRPVAFIKMRGKKKILSDQFRQKLALKIPRYMIPDHFFYLPEKVENKNFKINRRILSNYATELLRNSND